LVMAHVMLHKLFLDRPEGARAGYDLLAKMKERAGQG
jgi:hypothetical protein